MQLSICLSTWLCFEAIFLAIWLRLFVREGFVIGRMTIHLRLPIVEGHVSLFMRLHDCMWPDATYMTLRLYALLYDHVYCHLYDYTLRQSSWLYGCDCLYSKVICKVTRLSRYSHIIYGFKAKCIALRPSLLISVQLRYEAIFKMRPEAMYMIIRLYAL